MPRNNIRLLHLITGLGIGGAERVVLDLSKNSVSTIFDIFVVSISKRIEMLNDYKNNNINIEVLEKGKSIKDFLQIILFLNNYVKKNKIKIIHAHMTHAMITAVIIKTLNPKIKIVFTSHSVKFGSKLREKVIHILKPFRSNDILFSTEQVSSIYKKSFEIIPNGIETETYQLSLPKYDKFTFLAVGRLETVKNHKLLLKCAADLKKENYNFQILIAGEGELREEIEKDIRINNLENFVIILGSRSDIAQLMSSSHAFVMPSLWEGLPIVMLEAGASSLPVISTPVGTIPSLINATTGYLSSQENFSQTMMDVIENYEEAKLRAIALNNKIINGYSINKVMKMHEAIYSNLV